MAVMDSRSGGEGALGVTEIQPRAGFYDYEAKYGEGGSIHVIPADIPPAVYDAALRMAERAHLALGCRGVTRSDFRYDDIKDDLVLLEVNTQPGMTPTSLAPEQAAMRAWLRTVGALDGGRRFMPAVMRAAPQGGRGKAKGGGRAAARATYSPAKLKGAGAVGLDPRAALWGALGLLCLVLLLTMFTGGRLALLAGRVGRSINAEFAHAGFKVKTVTVQGAADFSTPYVLHAAALTAGQPILGLDLEALRERVEQVGWIKSAKVIRLLPDTIVIAVTERARLAVWQHGPETSVVDKDGQIIPEADASLFSDLPLIVGEGANEGAGVILSEVAARPALQAKLDALVRVDGRRWDLRLKDGGIVQLPAVKEDSALIEFDQLDQKSHLLETGFERVDLRDPEMTVVRPRAAEIAAAPAQTATKAYSKQHRGRGESAALASAASAESGRQVD